MPSRAAAILVAILLSTAPSHVFGDGNAPSGGSEIYEPLAPTKYLSQDIHTLEQVTVVGQAEDLITGSSALTGDIIQQLPKKNSSLTETITLLPRVQIGEGQRTSENAGEILPPLISISGGRAYENYYSVDGISQGSLLDPLTNKPKDIKLVPGHPQRTFIHQDLIESVEVYDSNISAKYGSFVGGVVEAKTRMPGKQLGGSLNYRTTRDTWTSFKVATDNADSFELSNDHLLQPKFKKHDAGLELDIPLNEDMGLLAAYKIIHSELKLRHFNKWHDQDKTLENYFLKYAWTPETPYTLELTAAYTPSEEEFFIKNTLNSDFTIDRGGYSLNGRLSGDLNALSFELSAAFLRSENSRTAPTDNYNWKISDSKDWGTTLGSTVSSEGAYGDIDSEETSYQLNTDFELNALTTGKLRHQVNFGTGYTQDQGAYDRKETSIVYGTRDAVLDNLVSCDTTDPSCVNKKQYFEKRGLYLAEKEDARINQYAGYIEDQMSIGAISFRPGVRISHDDFMNNTDVAHRLAASWDLFHNGKTVLVGGSNRYYGGPLLTYKLREAIEPLVTETRSVDADNSTTEETKLLGWEFDKQATFYNSYSQLDTPYSDELTIGVVQRVLGGKLSINYLERDNKSQFASETVNVVTDGESRWYKVLNNNGSSKYESIKASWDRQWRKHYLNVNYTHSDQEASNEEDGYEDIFDIEDTESQVWYKGSLINRTDLPRQDYNRKHLLNIIYVGQLPRNFTFTNVARYRSGYKALQDTKKNITLDSGERYDIYAEIKQPDYWIFDWRIDWEKAVSQTQRLTLSIEVNNVFNCVPPSGDSSDTYELGRQFWLGLTYKF